MYAEDEINEGGDRAEDRHALQLESIATCHWARRAPTSLALMAHCPCPCHWRRKRESRPRVMSWGPAPCGGGAGRWSAQSPPRPDDLSLASTSQHSAESTAESPTLRFRWAARALLQQSTRILAYSLILQAGAKPPTWRLVPLVYLYAVHTNESTPLTSSIVITATGALHRRLSRMPISTLRNILSNW